MTEVDGELAMIAIVTKRVIIRIALRFMANLDVLLVFAEMV